MKTKTPKATAEQISKVCELVHAKFTTYKKAKNDLTKQLNDEVFEICEREKMSEKHIRLVLDMPAPLKIKP